MISPSDLWAAIDRLAYIKGTTVLELAMEAGLPASAFLPEKRLSDSGELSWPSLEAITLLVTAAGASIREFGKLVDEAGAGDMPALQAHLQH